MKKNKNLILPILQAQFKSLVVLNGALEEKSLFIELSQTLPVIAVDGGLNCLNKINFIPDYIAGDLDSALNLKFKKEIIHLPDQNKTDFQKTIEWVDAQNLFPCLAFGMSGKFFDRQLFNFFQAYDSKLSFITKNLVGLYVEKSIILNIEVGTKVSMIGNGVLSTFGLKWELKNQKINFFNSSCSNKTIEKEFEMKVIEGSCMLFIYFKKTGVDEKLVL